MENLHKDDLYFSLCNETPLDNVSVKGYILIMAFLWLIVSFPFRFIGGKIYELFLSTMAN